MRHFQFETVRMPPEVAARRQQVRAFVAEEAAKGYFQPRRNSWVTFDAAFSRKCGEQGLIGITWPRKYGGREASSLERYAISEELLAAGAPVGAHWAAERQSGDQILRYGTEAAKNLILPKITAGECFFAIGMSEPDAGSDLAAARSRATRTDGGWLINGTKIWTSNAHRAHYLIMLARTAPRDDGSRHAGFTEFIVNLAEPGITVRPIYNLYGERDFNEVVFEDYFVPDHMVVGEVGAGWKMVTSELSFERSGPDRFLSTYQLLAESIRLIGPEPDERKANEIGRLVAHLSTLRRMSGSIAGMLSRGEQPAVEAALVKDIGTAFEREIPEIFRLLLPNEPTVGPGSRYDELMAMAVLEAPSFTIRAGTREILRGIIARALELR